MTKKKILVLVDWFAPGYKAGGPIQSCVNFAFAMKDDYSVHVLTTDTDHGETSPYDGITAMEWTTAFHPDIRVFYLRKAGLSARGIKEQIDAVQADYIYLNHLFSPLFVVYPLWLKYRGRVKSEIVVCPRGALYDSALSVKRWKKTPFLRLFRWMSLHKNVLFHATNQREKDAILQHFPGSKVLIADNLPNMNQSGFVSISKKPGVLKCIFIARIVPIKNLLYLLTALEKVTANVEVTVIGPVEDKAYWNECSQKIAGLPGNVTVTYEGPKRNDQLIPILQQHHLFVLPTTGENFGHSIFEAFLAGRPVLISDQTPWLGLADQKAGWDLPLKDSAAFTLAIEQAAGWDQARFDEWAEAAWSYAHRFINNPELQSQYFKLFA
ncbi:MAG TPA: glycosyltransferase family 4 protein [Puia sp.]|jgi:glycosyltransferase involved in cell wall biosynthesis|nr:glycosyltransferase family 4 protein [Puia sp.]